MGELARVLLHPAHWTEAAPDERFWLAGALVLVTVAFASLAGVASSRWARGRAKQIPAGAATELSIARVRRGSVVLLTLIGLYYAIEVAPLPHHLGATAGGVVWVLAALMAARLVIHLVSLLLTTSLARVSGSERTRLEREYVPLGEKVTTLAIALIFVIVTLKHFGQDVTSLVAALGVGSLAIGLAAQQTLGNMIAGFVLLVDRPFRPGDRIRLASGETGEVLEIGVRSTRIRLGDANLLIVPNAELANTRVVNHAFPHLPAAAEVKVTLAHAADVERAGALLVEAMRDDDRVAAEPQPAVRVAALTPLGIELVVSARVKVGIEAAAVEDGTRRRLLARFRAEKIELARAPG